MAIKGLLELCFAQWKKKNLCMGCGNTYFNTAFLIYTKSVEHLTAHSCPLGPAKSNDTVGTEDAPFLPDPEGGPCVEIRAGQTHKPFLFRQVPVSDAPFRNFSSLSLAYL